MNEARRPGFVIAVDGAAASGKGTIAARLAARYGLPHLDTGLLYRGVGVAVMRAGVDLADEVAAE
ncbi:(d)CMP kinase, partial [Acinetobacter baumannii]